MHLLLDLDGTLTDPRQGFVSSVSLALRTLGRPVPPEDVLAARIGPPLEETMALFMGPSDPEKIKAAIALYREQYGDVGLFQNRPYDGIAAALGQLQARGTRLHLATSKPRVFAERILDRFELTRFFTSVHGSELDGTRTDKGELIAFLLRQEGVTANEALMVGDRYHDVRGASRNGMACYGVLWGYGSREELTQAGATRLLATPTELGELTMSST